MKVGFINLNDLFLLVVFNTTTNLANLYGKYKDTARFTINCYIDSYLS